jgi:hypothetical protein
MQPEQEVKDPASGPEVLSEAQLAMLKTPPKPEAPAEVPADARGAHSPPPPPDLRPPPKAVRDEPEIYAAMEANLRPGPSPRLSDKLDTKLKKKRGRPKKVKKNETD